MKPQELVKKIIEALSENNEYMNELVYEPNEYVDEEIFREEFKRIIHLKFLKGLDFEAQQILDPTIMARKKMAVKELMFQLKVVNDISIIKTGRKQQFLERLAYQNCTQ
jgi:hypothetical protein